MITAVQLLQPFNGQITHIIHENKSNHHRDRQVIAFGVNILIHVTAQHMIMPRCVKGSMANKETLVFLIRHGASCRLQLLPQNKNASCGKHLEKADGCMQRFLSIKKP